MTATILNRQISIFVSDPWDFGTECGVGPLKGRVLDAREKKLLVKLDAPIKYKDKIFHRILGSLRHEGMSLVDILMEPISLNFVLLPQEVNAISEINRDIFSSGIALIGTVEASY